MMRVPDKTWILSSNAIEQQREQERAESVLKQNEEIYYILHLARQFAANPELMNNLVDQMLVPPSFAQPAWDKAELRAFETVTKIHTHLDSAYRLFHDVRQANEREGCAVEVSEHILLGQLGNFAIGNCISKGSVGDVHLSVDTDSGDTVAIKLVSTSTLDKLATERMREEATVSRMMNHRNVVKMYDAYEFDQHVLFCLEYANGGDLIQYLHSQPAGVPEEHAAGIFLQVCEGLEYMHKKLKVAHRDLKPENIMLHFEGSELVIKLVDFGVATSHEAKEMDQEMVDFVYQGSKDRTPEPAMLQEFCGTAFYMAPEVILGNVYEGPPADVWSLGVVLYALIGGTLPFRGEDFETLRLMVTSGIVQLPPALSKLGGDLLSRMMSLEAGRRPTISQVLQHDFFKQV